MKIHSEEKLYNFLSDPVSLVDFNVCEVPDFFTTNKFLIGDGVVYVQMPRLSKWGTVVTEVDLSVDH